MLGTNGFCCLRFYYGKIRDKDNEDKIASTMYGLVKFGFEKFPNKYIELVDTEAPGFFEFTMSGDDGPVRMFFNDLTDLLLAIKANDNLNEKYKEFVTGYANEEYGTYNFTILLHKILGWYNSDNVSAYHGILKLWTFFIQKYLYSDYLDVSDEEIYDILLDILLNWEHNSQIEEYLVIPLAWAAMAHYINFADMYLAKNGKGVFSLLSTEQLMKIKGYDD